MITHKHSHAYVIVGLVLALVIMLPVFSLKAANSNSNIACFVYHRFGDDRYFSTNISIEAFREQLTYLKQNNFRVWTMGKAAKAIRNGDIVPPKTVVLTIDDGYHSFYENGLPLLEEFGYPATLFVNTENIGNKDYLSWQEILDAQRRGIEIGNHSHGHGHFLNIPSEEERKNIFISDLVTTQTLFNEHLGYTPDLYSYPYGEYDAMMQEILEKAGYLAATAQYSGVLYKGSNLFEIPRFPMGGPYATVKGFIQKSQMLAMQLSSIEPAGIVLQQNPPILEITIQSYCIDVEKVQCFVNGQRNCIVELHESPDVIRMKIKSRDRLTGRRTLYTLTAPSKDGKGWCWYSHVWVNTEVEED
jgi:peptidoglycan/xylan/chitin deacetylase (PgdA/CDA1 family)